MKYTAVTPFFDICLMQEGFSH